MFNNPGPESPLVPCGRSSLLRFAENRNHFCSGFFMSRRKPPFGTGRSESETNLPETGNLQRTTDNVNKKKRLSALFKNKPPKRMWRAGTGGTGF